MKYARYLLYGFGLFMIIGGLLFHENDLQLLIYLLVGVGFMIPLAYQLKDEMNADIASITELETEE